MPDVPLSTYRLQLTGQFNFDAAAAIAPYLKSLGISHVYASPFTKARSGSTHGYDVVDHTKFNPELGGSEGFARFSDALKQNNLGLILDFVPNHVGVHFADNPWWLDVLEWGQASPHANAFDIDWDSLAHRGRSGILLPIIGGAYGNALENGDIALRYDPAEGSFSAWYFEHRLPIAPQRYGEVLRSVVAQAGGESSDAGQALLALAKRSRGLRHPSYQEAPAFKAELRSIEGGQAMIERGLASYHAGPGREAETLALHRLLERQHYRLGHWRLASSEINYRRFFDVNTLAGLRVEDASVFEAAHRLVRTLISEDRLQGLRLDHIDGLRDPAQYFQRLRRLVRDAQGNRPKPFYILIEKILGEHEALPKFAGVHGTTGYEWLNVISQVLLDGSGLDTLDEAWRQVSNIAPNFPPLLFEAKRRVIETLLSSEFTVLTRLLARIAAGHYSTRDFSSDDLRQAFELYVLHFPVYRTYMTQAGPSESDRALIIATIEKARADWFGADEGLFDFLRDALTMDLIAPGRAHHSKPRVRRFALKVQQFTGPAMAKSLEDTAFYRYHRLVALNEVGGDPAAHALALPRFHSMMQTRARDWPHGMTATATHDTKRGEDARTRLLALAEIAGEWTSAVSRWKTMNAPHLVTTAGVRAPSAAFEYLLYQTLVGAWPLDPREQSAFAERVQAYALKAARESKTETSWLNPNQTYEDGLRVFIERLLDPSRSSEFLQSLDAFVQRIALLGALNSLSQITLKATMPGVPDFYQGSELWDFSMVDPDNRRPVNFKQRASMLGQVERLDWPQLLREWQNGQIKLAWTHRLLQLRNELAGAFTDGDYQPLDVTGRDSANVIAYARRFGKEAAIVVVGRAFNKATQGGRVWPSGDNWDGNVVINGLAVDVLHGTPNRTELPLADVFRDFPAAVVKARVERP